MRPPELDTHEMILDWKMAILQRMCQEDEGMKTSQLNITTAKPFEIFYRIENEEGKIITSCAIRDNPDGKRVIWDLSTDSDYRRQGYATKLLTFLCEKFINHDLFLTCDPMDDKPMDKEQLAKFYRKFGFEFYSSQDLWMTRAAR
jgi:GNAT superfamily N-acetyltransferase